MPFSKIRHILKFKIDLFAVQVSNNEREIFVQIKKTPSMKDVTISKRLEKLKKFNNKNNNDDDNDDDDDENGDLPHLPTPPFFVPKNNELDSEFDSDDKKLNPTQKFLLDKPSKSKISSWSRQNPSCHCTATSKNNS